MQIQRLFINTLCIAIMSLNGAAAATITLVDRATFQTALNGGILSGQNFDSISPGTVLTSLGGVSYGASQGSPVVTGDFQTTTGLNGLGSTSQSSYFNDTESASFTFATPITAFAIDVNTFAPTAGDYTATLNLGNVVNSTLGALPTSATGQFLGFVSDTAFNSVRINAIFDRSEGGAFTYTLDTLAYGSASAVTSTPEPSTLALLGTGFALFWFKLRKRL